MTKCNRCGMINDTNAMHCQSCGTPLSGKVEGGFGPGGAVREQPELPAWLETLRAGERSASPANPISNFPPTDIEEGTLPSWMRAERDEASNVTGPNAPVSPLRSASAPAPQTGDDARAQSSMSARSLIDDQALPTWMQEQKAGSAPQENIAASSLVQPDSVPDWMKTLQQQQSAHAAERARSAQPISPEGPAMPTNTPEAASPFTTTPSSSAGFSAHDLIDQQALPSWMNQQGSSANNTPAAPAPQSSGPVNVPNEKGFSAHDLVDKQALPSWMNQLGSQGPSSQPQAQERPSGSVNVPAEKGFSARDLVDQQALPSWMSQQNPASSGNTPPAANTASPGQAGFSASSLLDADSLPPWLRQGQGQPGQPPAPNTTPPAQNIPNQSNATPASSFIDMNALPDWMQQGQAQQPAPNQGAYGNTYQGQQQAPAGPPRVENVRVPSRPRGEVSTSETSEMAANVLASMLGVASAAPNYPQAPGAPTPGQHPPQQGWQQQAPQGYTMGQQGQMGSNPNAMPGAGGPQSMSGQNMPTQGGMPGQQMPYQNQQGMQSQQGMSYPGNQPMPTGQPQQGYGMPQHQQNPYGNSQAGIPGTDTQMGGPHMGGNSYGGYPTGNNTPMGQSPYGPPMANPGAQPGQEQKNKKRGIVGALLDWLSR